MVIFRYAQYAQFGVLVFLLSHKHLFYLQSNLKSEPMFHFVTQFCLATMYRNGSGNQVRPPCHKSTGSIITVAGKEVSDGPE